MTYAIRIILAVVAVVVLVILVAQYHRKKAVVATTEEEAPMRSSPKMIDEHFTAANEINPARPMSQPAPLVAPAVEAVATPQGSSVRPNEPMGNEDYKAVDFNTENKIPNDCFPRDKLTVEDLLPKDAANSTWAQVNPAGQGDVKDQNFLTAGFHSGVNTVGQTMKNPNLQLRSEPPNPKMKVGPWNQSTIEFDTSRRHFEVGEC